MTAGEQGATDPGDPSRAAFLATVLDQLEEGVYFVDTQRRITLWNRGAETITGWPAELVLGRRCADGILSHCNEAGDILCGSGCPLLAAMSDGQSRSAEVFMLRRDGARIPVYVRVAPIRDEQAEITGCVEVFSNNADRLAVLDEIKHLRDEAMLDPLTGLPNRRFLLSRLPRIFSEAAAHAFPVAVVFIDLDHFKQINDVYGHDGGDEVLKVAAATLRSGLRALDVIGRWGGEEFLVVTTGLVAEQLRGFAERLRALLERCVVGRPAADILISASIGCTLARPDEPWTEAITRADRLMYESKRNGRNRVTQS